MAELSDDPGLVAYLESLQSDDSPSAREQGVDILRARMAERTAARPKGPEVERVESLFALGETPIPLRLYRPRTGPLPLLVFFHGGGWTIGDLHSHDRLCRRVAASCGIGVLAVDYRLAPEHPYPAALDDAVAVVRWVRGEPAELGEVTQLGVGGDSAGASIATLACLRLRDAGEDLPDLQVLINPHLDLTGSGESMQEKAIGWGLRADDARWFAERWVPDAETRSNPRVSPVFEEDLSGMPPAIVVTMEHDPLRDEGDLYASRLLAAGVPVIHRCEPHLVHGYMSMDLVSTRAAAAHEVLFADIATALHQ